MLHSACRSERKGSRGICACFALMGFGVDRGRRQNLQPLKLLVPKAPHASMRCDAVDDAFDDAEPLVKPCTSLAMDLARDLDDMIGWMRAGCWARQSRQKAAADNTRLRRCPLRSWGRMTKTCIINA